MGLWFFSESKYFFLASKRSRKKISRHYFVSAKTIFLSHKFKVLTEHFFLPILETENKFQSNLQTKKKSRYIPLQVMDLQMKHHFYIIPCVYRTVAWGFCLGIKHFVDYTTFSLGIFKNLKIMSLPPPPTPRRLRPCYIFFKIWT